MSESIEQEQEFSQRRPRLLFADVHVMVIAGILRLLGPAYEIVVQDGAAALAAAKKLQPDIVLLEIALPVIDGTCKSTAQQVTRKSPTSRRLWGS